MRHLILIALALAFAAPARAQQEVTPPPPPASNPAVGGFHFFGSVDFYLPGNSDQEMRKAHDNTVASLRSLGYFPVDEDFSRTGGVGLRGGILYDISSKLQLGGSLHLVGGPTTEADINAKNSILGDGTAHVKRTSGYFLLMAEMRQAVVQSKNADLSLNLAFGPGAGHVEQECRATGSISCVSGKVREGFGGVAFEAGPSLNLHLGRADLNMALRFTHFPRFKGSTAKDLDELNWDTLGASIGLTF